MGRLVKGKDPKGTQTEPHPLPVGRWVNVWHQLDPLAIVVQRAIALAQPAAQVQDWRLPLHDVPTSEQDLSFHPSYWTAHWVLEWLRTELED
jgi:hypothetical protein